MPRPRRCSWRSGAGRGRGAGRPSGAAGSRPVCPPGRARREPGPRRARRSSSSVTTPRLGRPARPRPPASGRTAAGSPRRAGTPPAATPRSGRCRTGRPPPRGGRRLERDVRQVLEQPAHVVGGVGAERRAPQHGPGRLPDGHRRSVGRRTRTTGTPVPASRSSSPPGARRAGVSAASSVTRTTARGVSARRAGDVVAGDVVGPARAGVGEVVVVARERRGRPHR